MNDRDWKCADPGIFESLREDASRPSTESRERVFRLLAPTLGIALLPTESSSQAPDGHAPFPSASLEGTARTSLRAALGRPWMLAVSFALGGGAGAAAYAALAPHPVPTIVYVERSARAPVAALPMASPPVDEGVGALASAAAALATAPPAASRMGSGAPSASTRNGGLADLAAQQKLLDTARAAFGRGDNEAALRAIAAHRRRYPDSVLSEEREALAIKTLVAEGRYSEAKARGARFIEQHPGSLLLPGVNESLATMP